MSDLELGKRRAQDLGLEITRDITASFDVYRAEDIHRLLGEGVEAIGNKGCDDWWANPMKKEALPKVKDVGLIIGIRPIVQEQESERTAKDILRDLLDNYEGYEGLTNLMRIVKESKILLDGDK